MKAQDVMTRKVATVDERDSLADAAKVMWDRACGFVPVTEAETGRLCGVLTDRDICMGAFTQSAPLDRIPVGVSMSHQTAICHPEDDLHTVEGVMRDHRVRRLPVVDEGGAVVGVLSLDDLARVALDPDVQQGDALRRDVAQTLGMVSIPEPVQFLRSISGHA